MEQENNEIIAIDGWGVTPGAPEVVRFLEGPQRRLGMPRVNPLLFYPARLREILTTYIPGLRFQSKLHKMRKRIQRDPEAKLYSDVAIAPLQEMEEENLQLFQSRESGRAALAKAKEKQARTAAPPRRLSA